MLKHRYIIIKALTALEGCVLYPRVLHVLLQLDEQDPKGIDDTEDDTVGTEAAEHHQPRL